MKRWASIPWTLALVGLLTTPALAAVEDTGFADVDRDSWYAGAVEYVRDSGIMLGTGETLFAPDQGMTRAMLATTLYRAAGSPAVEGEAPFTDTQAGTWYTDGVAWAAQTGIIGGHGDGRFGPNDPVTREQAAQMLWNAAGQPEAPAGEPYADQADISAYAVEAVAWAQDSGLMVGRNGNRFVPQGNVTRAEAATILYNRQNNTPPEEPTDPEENQVLVVYFSATGNTQMAAEYIADLAGGDLFPLEPADPYTDADLNWTDESSRVVYEYTHPEARDVALVADTVDNWEAYDTVFVGYPIWWGIAAWPVDTFVAANDFTGKTVIPFCTSSSSGIGESGQLLADLAGTGDWQEGQRFSSHVDRDAVETWLAGLGLA